MSLHPFKVSAYDEAREANRTLTHGINYGGGAHFPNSLGHALVYSLDRSLNPRAVKENDGVRPSPYAVSTGSLMAVDKLDPVTWSIFVVWEKIFPGKMLVGVPPLVIRAFVKRRTFGMLKHALQLDVQTSASCLRKSDHSITDSEFSK